MKKILSAVLAAAMVLSMGVLAFADVNFGEGTATPVAINDKVYQDPADGVYYSSITFDKVLVVRNGKVDKTVNANNAYDELQANDTLYFPVVERNSSGSGSNYTTDAPKNWQIKINNAEYVDGADFYHVTSNPITGLSANQLYVKVTLSDFSDFEGEDVNFYFYIYDRTNKTRSDRAVVKYEMESYNATLTEEDLDWVITVAGPKAYKYSKSAKAKLATFDFNEAAFVEVKLFPNTTYKVNVNEKFNKDIAKLYPEADFDFVELTGNFDKTADVVIPSSKDNKYIYEVVDGDLVAVDAEFVKDHKFESGEKVNGYLFTTTELGQYAISNVELDLEDEDVDTDVEAPSVDNGDKTNPPMGANDFVGAAVALAVVSVAAAGALALKK